MLKQVQHDKETDGMTNGKDLYFSITLRIMLKASPLVTDLFV
jgi:hypothetical protein